MNFKCRRQGPIAVVDLAGHWSTSPGEIECLELRRVVSELMMVGCFNVAFNLGGLMSLDARGLGELVFILKRLRSVGGELTLVAPGTLVRKMLAVTRLDTIIPSCDRECELWREDVQPDLIATTLREPRQSPNTLSLRSQN